MFIDLFCSQTKTIALHVDLWDRWCIVTDVPEPITYGASIPQWRLQTCPKATQGGFAPRAPVVRLVRS